jgi:hypothetical protein
LILNLLLSEATEVYRNAFGRMEKRCAKLREQLSKFGQKLLKLTGAVPPLNRRQSLPFRIGFAINWNIVA